MKRLMNFIEARVAAAYLKKTYPQVAAEIGRVVSATKMGYQNSKIPFWKNADLMRILEAYQPSRICEFGSGTTTASFNGWVKAKPDLRRGLTFESHPEWHRIVSEHIAFSENYTYVLSDVCAQGRAAEFREKPTSFDPDFVYIDAPPIVGDVEYNTDFLWIIDNLPLPRVFVIDVRYKTVSEMYRVFKERGFNYQLHVSREFPVELLGPKSDFRRGTDVRHSIFELP